MLKMKVLGAAVVVLAGLFFAGCQSAPELTQANALALVQASYDKAPAKPIEIVLGKDGLTAGITAKLWGLSKIYPNRYWADYTLTPEGKKAVKLEKGEVIEWRPDHFGDDAHTQAISAVATAKLKAKDAKAPEKVSSKLVTVAFTEALSMEGVPQGVQDLLHQPGNKLSEKKVATFVLDNGAWKLDSVK